MVTLPFYACDEDLLLIQAEQDRFAAGGIRVSESEAIRSLILRASAKVADAAQAAATAANGSYSGKGLKFFVLPPGKTQNGRVEKVFID